MSHSWEDEIRALHSFFEAWYWGEVPNSDGAFARVSDYLAPEFTLITSSGFAANRTQVLGMLRSEHAAKPDLTMSVKDLQLKLVSGEIVLATYEEHGTTADGKRVTLITAVLRKNLTLDNGLEWVHIHEALLNSE